MAFRKLCVLVLWAKIASALEGLITKWETIRRVVSQFLITILLHGFQRYHQISQVVLSATGMNGLTHKPKDIPDKCCLDFDAFENNSEIKYRFEKKKKRRSCGLGFHFHFSLRLNLEFFYSKSSFRYSDSLICSVKLSYPEEGYHKLHLWDCEFLQKDIAINCLTYLRLTKSKSWIFPRIVI